MEIEIGKKTQIIIAILLLTGIAGAVSEYGNNVIISGYFSGDGSNITGIKIPYSYVIYIDGTNYYAKNGSTGVVDYSGTNASLVIQQALDNAPKGKLFFKRGVYLLDVPIILPDDQDDGGLVGEAYGYSTILTANSPMSSIIHTTGLTNSPARYIIEDLGFNGNSVATNDIVLDYSPGGSVQLRLNRLYITNSVETAIKLNNVEDTILENSIIANGGLYWYAPNGNVIIHDTYIGGNTEVSHQINISAQQCNFDRATIYAAIKRGCRIMSFDQSYIVGATGVDRIINITGEDVSLSVRDSLIAMSDEQYFVESNSQSPDAVIFDNIVEFGSGTRGLVSPSTGSIKSLYINMVRNVGGGTLLTKRAGSGTIDSYYVRYSDLSEFASGTAIYSNTNQTYQAAP